MWRQDAGCFGCDTEDEGTAVIFVCVWFVRDDVGTVLRTGLYRQFDNAIQNMAYWLAVDQIAAGLRGVSVAEENALGREIAVIQTKLLLPRAAMTR